MWTSPSTVFGVFLTLVLTFILVWDGDRLWHRLVRAAGPRWSDQVDAAGRAAWNSVSGYVHGTLVIAAFHGTVIGVTLTLLGVHPVVTVLAVAALGVLGGVPGALIAVPPSSVAGRVVPVLLGRTVVDDEGHPHPVDGEEPDDGGPDSVDAAEPDPAPTALGATGRERRGPP